MGIRNSNIYWTRQWARPLTSEKQKIFLCLLIVLFLLIQPAKHGVLGSEIHQHPENFLKEGKTINNKIQFEFQPRFIHKLFYFWYLISCCLGGKEGTKGLRVLPANWTDTRVQPSNAMTCLSSDDTRENNCVQVIQASFSQTYSKTFNSSLEFRLIYSYSDVSPFTHTPFSSSKFRK